MSYKYQKQIDYLNSIDTSSMSVKEMLKDISCKFDIPLDKLSGLKCKIYELNIPRKLNTLKKRGRPISKHSIDKKEYLTEFMRNKTVPQAFSILKDSGEYTFTTMKGLQDYLTRNDIKYLKYTDIIPMYLDSEIVSDLFKLTNLIEKQLFYELFSVWCLQNNLCPCAAKFFFTLLNRNTDYKLFEKETGIYYKNIKSNAMERLYYNINGINKDISNYKNLISEKSINTFNTMDVQITEGDLSENNINEMNAIEVHTENESDNICKDLVQEVNTVLDRKCKLLDCYLEQHYNTDDYIQMLSLLLYLCDSYKSIEYKQTDRHDIMNKYQDDIIHNIENTESDGSTYLQDKLHILRNIRRDCEYDIKDLKFMEGFLQSIDKEKLESALSSLNKAKEQRQNPIYIPMVDMDMTKKYEWARPGTLANNKVHKEILTTNKERQNLNTYRASCSLSGGKYGVFKKWFKDFQKVDEDSAYKAAQVYLDKLVANSRGSVIYTGLDIHIINN